MALVTRNASQATFPRESLVFRAGGAGRSLTCGPGERARVRPESVQARGKACPQRSRRMPHAGGGSCFPRSLPVRSGTPPQLLVRRGCCFGSALPMDELVHCDVLRLLCQVDDQQVQLHSVTWEAAHLGKDRGSWRLSFGAAGYARLLDTTAASTRRTTSCSTEPSLVRGASGRLSSGGRLAPCCSRTRGRRIPSV